MMDATPSMLTLRLLEIIEKHIVPRTREGVATGSKVFGAAILCRKNFTPFTVATNNEKVSPLLHGEVNCIQNFYTVDYPDADNRPDPCNDCIFLATHEPCSLCLSAIAWAGFSEVYYLFTYEDSRNLFSIPHDINILEEVFRVRADGESEVQLQQRPLYNRKNKFFMAKSLRNVVDEIGDESEQSKWLAKIESVKHLYTALSEQYQDGKVRGVQNSSVWK